MYNYSSTAITCIKNWLAVPCLVSARVELKQSLLPETVIEHNLLSNNDQLFVENYIWIGHNRKNIHINARKGSGDVGFLVHNRLLILYNIVNVDKSVDGVIKVLLRHKYNDCSIVLFGCYIRWSIGDNTTRPVHRVLCWR